MDGGRRRRTAVQGAELLGAWGRRPSGCCSSHCCDRPCWGEPAPQDRASARSTRCRWGDGLVDGLREEREGSRRDGGAMEAQLTSHASAGARQPPQERPPGKTVLPGASGFNFARKDRTTLASRNGPGESGCRLNPPSGCRGVCLDTSWVFEERRPSASPWQCSRRRAPPAQGGLALKVGPRLDRPERAAR